MKTFLQYFAYAVLFIGTTLSMKAQSQEWLWAKSAGGINRGQCITTDKKGNVYVAGRFESPSIAFDTIVLKTAPKNEYYDMFVVKYNSQGAVVWARSIGGIYQEDATGIATDDIGNVYVTGYTNSLTIISGDLQLDNTGEMFDMFIAKYDGDGNTIWAKSMGGNYDDFSTGIITGNNGDFYLTGYFQSSSIQFGNINFVNSSNTINYYGEMFLVKFNSDGNVLWADAIQGIGNERGYSLTKDNQNNIYVTGTFNSKTIVFGSDTLVCSYHSMSHAQDDAADIFIAKYSADGDVLWARSAQGSDHDRSYSITADSLGNIYISGCSWSYDLTFGEFDFSDSTDGYTDLFIVKYDQSGNTIWAQKFASSDVNSIISCDSKGDVYLTSSYSKEIKLGTTTLTNFGGTLDIFLAKFNSDGIVQWAESPSVTFGNNKVSNSCYGYGLSINNNDEVSITGVFTTPNIAFGQTTLVNQEKGKEKIFIAKLSGLGTSINEEAFKKTKTTIFPKPTTSQFHITNLAPGNWTITIYTLNGQSVFKKELTEANAMIDLSGKAKGAYVYRLLKDGEVFKTGKLVLE
ncbi:MAG TPA: SBBP repeat-containing protein [Patescibacteria group bacterium]|nr:SBBP repeat-containing protein [Patescibacteria group bacterium]